MKSINLHSRKGKRLLALVASIFLIISMAIVAVTVAGPAQAATCTVVNPDNSNCGPYADSASFTPSNGFNTYVGPDVFNPVPGESWGLTVNDPSSWNITANIPAGDTAVSMYPSTGQQFPDPRNPQQGTPLSEFSSLTSQFAEAMNANSGTDGEAAYDLWFDNSGSHNELMIQFDNHGAQANCANAGLKVASAIFTDAVNGPQSWDFCLYGTEMIFQLPGTGVEHSGSPDILAMMRWTQDHGYIASTSLFTLMGFGAEFCSTGGQPETFTVSHLNALATYAGGPSPSPTPTATSPSPSPSPTSPSPTPTSPSPTPTATSPSPSPSPGTRLVGDSTVEASTDSNMAGQAQATMYTAAASGTSQTFSFYVDPSSTATAGDLGVYSDASGNPGTLLGQAPFTPHPGWNTVTLAGVRVTAGARYWLAELGTQGVLAFRDAGWGAYSPGSLQTGLTSLPAVWRTGPAWSSGRMSAYISG